MVKNSILKKEAYKDSSKTVEKRVKNLVSLMNLDEKIAQMGSIWVYEVLKGKKFSSLKADSLMGNGIGQITRLGGASNFRPKDSAKMANKYRVIFLRIPVWVSLLLYMKNHAADIWPEKLHASLKL